MMERLYPEDHIEIPSWILSWAYNEKELGNDFHKTLYEKCLRLVEKHKHESSNLNYRIEHFNKEFPKLRVVVSK